MTAPNEPAAMDRYNSVPTSNNMRSNATDHEGNPEHGSHMRIDQELEEQLGAAKERKSTMMMMG